MVIKSIQLIPGNKHPRISTRNKPLLFGIEITGKQQRNTSDCCLTKVKTSAEEQSGGGCK